MDDLTIVVVGALLVGNHVEDVDVDGCGDVVCEVLPVEVLANDVKESIFKTADDEKLRMVMMMLELLQGMC